MPRSCVVPSCKSRENPGQKISFFQVPRNEEERKRWASQIPAIQSLRANHRVCEEHFAESCIIREYNKFDNAGNLLLQVVIYKIIF